MSKKFAQEDSDQGKRAHDAHVKGIHNPGKQVNHTAPLNSSRRFRRLPSFFRHVKVKCLRPASDGTSECGERVPGAKPGKTLVATNNITWKDTGKLNPGQTTQAKGVLTGNKDGKQFLNKHLSGLDDKSTAQRVSITTTKNGVKKTSKFDESGFSESSSDSAKTKPKNKTEENETREKSKEITKLALFAAKTKPKNKTEENETREKSKKGSKLAAAGRIAAMSAAHIAVDIGDQALMNAGVGVSAFAGTEKTVHAAVENNVGGIRVISAGAGASVEKAYAGAKATPLGASASAGASAAEASAEAVLIEGLAARAKASTCEANAGASAGVLGVQAGAGARVARVETGITNTPLQAHVEAVGAGAEAGVSLAYTGASAGAHLGEARAGPFAVRAGVRFGGGVRNGVPEVDLGPITAPCSIM